MRDPNRIDPILARLRAAWIASPDLRLGQLLACSLAIGGAEDKFARLFNAECPEFVAVNAPIEWPPVDRPAPTPAPAPGLDLDAVERAERAMTPGPWSMRRESHFVQIRAADHEELATTEQARSVDVANAAGIVALRNAASALIAEVRRLRAQVDADRRAYLDVCDAIAPETSGPADAAAKARATRKERDDLRAKLATAKRLGMEACDLADEATGSASEAPDCAEQVADYRERERAIRLSIGKV